MVAGVETATVTLPARILCAHCCRQTAPTNSQQRRLQRGATNLPALPVRCVVIGVCGTCTLLLGSRPLTTLWLLKQTPALTLDFEAETHPRTATTTTVSDAVPPLSAVVSPTISLKKPLRQGTAAALPAPLSLTIPYSCSLLPHAQPALPLACHPPRATLSLHH